MNNKDNPFIGRDKELTLFTDCFEAILPQNNGKKSYESLPQILSFYGVAGVGKTALGNKIIELAKNLFPEVVIWKIDTDYFVLKANLKAILTQKYGDNIELNWAQWLGATEKETNITAWKKVLNNQPLLVLIDGVDDLEMESYSQTIREFILPFTKEFKQVLFVFFGRSAQQLLYKATFRKHGQYHGKFYEQELKPLTPEESKRFLNGFIAQFSDENLQKLYAYTKGNPDALQFLINLVKERKIPMEIILKELINNEGKLITDFKELLNEKQLQQTENEVIEHQVLAVMTHNLNHKFEYLQNDFGSMKVLIGIENRTTNQTQMLDEILNRFQNNLNDAVSTFNTAHNVLVMNKINPQSTNLVEFFNQEKVNYLKLPFSIEIVAQNAHVIADIDQDSFRDLIRNLLNNADKHAFSKKTNNNRVVFDISETTDYDNDTELTNFAKITYKDNGQGLPPNFDFTKYKQLTEKAGREKGAGIGGYWINKVIELHGGKFRKKNTSPNETFKLQLEILIPLKHKIR